MSNKTDWAKVVDQHEGIVYVRESGVDGVLGGREPDELVDGPFVWLAIEQGHVPPPLDRVEPGRAFSLLSVSDVAGLIQGLQAFVDDAIARP